MLTIIFSLEKPTIKWKPAAPCILVSMILEEAQDNLQIIWISRWCLEVSKEEFDISMLININIGLSQERLFWLTRLDLES